jgi:hypothetical protein
MRLVLLQPGLLPRLFYFHQSSTAITVILEAVS